MVVEFPAIGIIIILCTPIQFANFNWNNWIHATRWGLVDVETSILVALKDKWVK